MYEPRGILQNCPLLEISITMTIKADSPIEKSILATLAVAINSDNKETVS